MFHVSLRNVPTPTKVDANAYLVDEGWVIFEKDSAFVAAYKEGEVVCFKVAAEDKKAGSTLEEAFKKIGSIDAPCNADTAARLYVAGKRAAEGRGLV